MNDPRDSPTQLQQALIALLEDDAADLSALDAMLRDDDAACDQYLNMIRLHATLQREFGGRAPLMIDSPPSPMTSAASRRGSRRRRRLLIPALSIAAAIALAITAWFALPPGTPSTDPTSPTTAIAVLTDSHDARWADNPSRTGGGASLTAGPMTLLQGHAQIMFNNGAVVDLQGPAEFELIGDNRGSLKRGTITAWVPQRAAGFTIDTPNCRVVDLGTEFMLAVDPLGLTRVNVLRGRVLIQPHDAAAWAQQELSAGGIAQIGTNLQIDSESPAPQRVLAAVDFESSTPDAHIAKRTNDRQTIRIVSDDASTFGPSWNRRAIAVIDDDPSTDLFSTLLGLPIPDDGDPRAPLQVRFDFKLLTPHQNPAVQFVNRNGVESNDNALSLSLAYPDRGGPYLAYAPERGELNLMAKMMTDRWYRLTLTLDRAGGRFSVDLQRRSTDGASVDQHLHFDDLPMKRPYLAPAQLQWMFNVPPGHHGGLLIDNVRISLPAATQNETS